MTKRIAILGSTGSIGTNTLDVLSRLGRSYEVTALSGDSNIESLALQTRRVRPKIICVGNEFLAERISASIPSGTKVTFGSEGLGRIVARRDVDLVVFAISGSSCLPALVEAIKNKKRIALANKEALVSAGPMIMKLAAKNDVRIIPVDSEHSAIFQCLDGRVERPAKIYLTGSGGPLLNVPKTKFTSISRASILKHPKWKMGKKISVDSATMMNKGLEVIEAKYLFGIDEKDIEVLIHPEAVIHSMVEFADGSVLAQLATPDMRLPIQYALTYPGRCPAIVERPDFSRIGRLSFSRPDAVKFPCLGLARAAARTGGLAPAVLCAADEEAVRAYLDGKIRFLDIPNIIEHCLARHRNPVHSPTLTDILKAEGWARIEARSICYH